MSRPEPNKPGPGQESVWDYPRPPRLEPFTGSITVELGGEVIASINKGTHQAWRVLETSHPPTYYLPRAAFAQGALRDAAGASWCEWKGEQQDHHPHTDHRATMRVHDFLTNSRVAVVCTTDDPADPLELHEKIRASGLKTRVYPTFRPDKAFAVGAPAVFNASEKA
jgi:uncharacterized protein (DUF427 family)